METKLMVMDDLMHEKLSQCINELEELQILKIHEQNVLTIPHL